MKRKTEARRAWTEDVKIGFLHWEDVSGFDVAATAFVLRSDSTKREVRLRFNPSIFDQTELIVEHGLIETEYQNSLNYIKARIDACIRKALEKK